MKRIIGLVVLAALLTTSTAWAQNKSAVINSPHDIGAAGCKSCHASHSGSASPGIVTTTPDPSSGQILLWDRNFPTQTYGVYDSPSLRTKGIAAIEVSGATRPQATDARMNSVLCMSCHDGITSTSVLPAADPFNVGSDKATLCGTSTVGCGLTNDHPVNVPHDNTKDLNLQAPTAVLATVLKLYNQAGSTVPTVQCASCHDSHNPAPSNGAGADGKGYFLRMSNANSAMCTTCHL